MKIISQSVGCCSVLLTVSFVLHKLFNFMRSHLSTVDLRARAIYVLFSELSPVPMSSRLFPTFSSMRFSVSSFMLSSLIHLDLSFVQGDRYGSTCMFLHAANQLVQHYTNPGHIYIYSQKMPNHPTKTLLNYVHNSFIRNTQKLETT